MEHGNDEDEGEKPKVKKAKRYRVQCLSCNKDFYNDKKKNHEKAHHNGKFVCIKLLGAPNSPWDACKSAPKRKQDLISDNKEVSSPKKRISELPEKDALGSGSTPSNVEDTCEENEPQQDVFVSRDSCDSGNVAVASCSLSSNENVTMQCEVVLTRLTENDLENITNTNSTDNDINFQKNEPQKDDVEIVSKDNCDGEIVAAASCSHVRVPSIRDDSENITNTKSPNININFQKNEQQKDVVKIVSKDNCDGEIVAAASCSHVRVPSIRDDSENITNTKSPNININFQKNEQQKDVVKIVSKDNCDSEIVAAASCSHENVTIPCVRVPFTRDDSENITNTNSSSTENNFENGVADQISLLENKECEAATSHVTSEKDMWLQCLGDYATIVDRMEEAKSLLSEIQSIDILDQFSTIVKMNNVAENIKEQCKKLSNLSKELLLYWEEKDRNIDEFPEFQHTDLVKHDPGERSPVQNRNQRLYLVSKGPHQPILNKFPKDKTGNRFNPIWYKQFPHLEYSVVKNAAFCFVCGLFPSSPSVEKYPEWWKHGVEKFGKMVSRGGQGKNAKLGKLKAHFSSVSHKAALQDYHNFMVETGHIDIALNKVARNDSLEVIRRKNFHTEVVSILMDVSRTLGRQGLAFRGRGDDSDGNFNQIVQLVARHNPILKEWLEKTSERSYHVTYLSSKSQNEFIELLGEEVKAEIIREIQCAPFYTIMADTTPDVSHKDILSLIIRFVDDNGIPKERLLKVIEAKEKTGVGIANCILSVLSSYQISTKNLAFQSYDMAANMSGEFRGAQQIISEKVEHKVHFTPCQAHRTNTAIEHCCQVDTSSIIANMFNILEELYVFFSASTKRFSFLQTNLEDVQNSLNLKNLSKTRWTVRAESIAAVIISFEKIVEVLGEYLNNETLSQSLDKATKAKIFGLYKNVRSADFIVSLFFMKNILYKLKILTETLELTELNILDAITAIRTSTQSLNRIRSSDTEVEDLITAAAAFCNQISVNVEEDFNRHHRTRVVPRRYDENNRNAAQLTYTTFYKLEFNSVLDSLISQLTSNVEACMENFRPAYEVFQIPISRENIKVDKLQSIIDMYPESCNKPDVLALEGELELLFDNCSTAKSMKDVAEICFKMKKIIPSASMLCKFLFTAAYSTASNERIFSRLKFIKNELRNKCLDQRLDFLMVLYCERDIVDNINFKSAVERWVTLKNRRIKL